MGKKKTVLERNGNAKNGKPWRNRHIDATPLDQEADWKIVEKTSTTMWLFGLVVVSLLSLITRLHNLQQPASVWLVFFWSIVGVIVPSLQIKKLLQTLLFASRGTL